MTNLRDTNYEMRIPGIFSLAGSTFMIATFLLFPNVRKLKHLQIVFYIGINDFFAATGVIIGEIKSNTPGCWYQGIATNFNILSSILWTTVLTYDLYSIVIFQERITNYTYYHILCWVSYRII